MISTVWLASYPKSGNTWFRLLLANAGAGDGAPVDINFIPSAAGIASARQPFENVSLIDSSLLSADEIDCLRPRIYEELARGLDAAADEDDKLPRLPLRLVKVHDAYTSNPKGEPLLAGRRGARGAILIVRDPRDVASSLAHHNGSSLDVAIARMNDANCQLAHSERAMDTQFRQKLLSWSGHVASWLDQTDVPTHLIRYEDMKADTFAAVRGALDFLELPQSDDDIRRAVAYADFALLRKQETDKGFAEASRAGGRFFRRGDAGGWREELGPGQVARIEEAHAPMMRRLGYDLSMELPEKLMAVTDGVS